MKIGVIGAGRLGITFALLCEQAGFDVLVSDVRQDYIDGLNKNSFNYHRSRRYRASDE